MNNQRKTAKIALIDLNHMMVGVHTNTVPLGAGMIASYLKKTVDYSFDIKLFKDPAKYINELKNWKPDVLGLAQYCWNSELNLYAAQLTKKQNPNCLTIAGGPNLYLAANEKFKYLNQWEQVDICVSHDGEIPFAAIVKRFVDGENIEDIRKSPSAGTYSIDKSNGELKESKEPPPKLDSLDIFGAIYAEGLFDEFFDEGFNPILQTAKGCPFKCAFCHTGLDYYDRIIFQSLDYVKQDLEYLGKRFSRQHHVPIIVTNENFGLFKDDLEIARTVRHIQEKYDWPRRFEITGTKDPKKNKELYSILKYKSISGIALQTLTPSVSKNIRRKNIPYDAFVAFQKDVVKNINENIGTELILSLPGETKKSFLETIYKVLDAGAQRIIIYTLMSLRGTPIASQETIKQYGHDIKFRVVPRDFSEINGTKIFEPEEVVVGTNSMPFEDYLYLRELALTITIFSNSSELYPLRKFIIENDLKIPEWIFNIHNNVAKYPNFYSVYKDFIQETKDELFPSREELVEFYSKQENFDLLRAGKLGDNLLRKYHTIVLSEHYEECLKIAFTELRRLAENKLNLKLLDSIINDFELYLNTRNIGYIFKEGYNQASQKTITLNYDIPKWLDRQSKSNPLIKNKGIFPYSVIITDYMVNRLEGISKTNRDKTLSEQILYRDGLIKDFWPNWIYKK